MWQHSSILSKIDQNYYVSNYAWIRMPFLQLFCEPRLEQMEQWRLYGNLCLFVSLCSIVFRLCFQIHFCTYQTQLECPWPKGNTSAAVQKCWNGLWSVFFASLALLCCSSLLDIRKWIRDLSIDLNIRSYRISELNRIWRCKPSHLDANSCIFQITGMFGAVDERAAGSIWV